MTFSLFSWAPFPNTNPWWHSWIQLAPPSNTHAPIPNTLTFLDVQIYLSETRKLKTKLCRKPTNCMTLLHFHSHHPLSCKEGIIYSQVLWYNMIISEDHILQEELNNLTRILLAHAYPLHLIIKNIKKSFDLELQPPVIPSNTTDRNQYYPHCNSFLRYW